MAEALMLLVGAGVGEAVSKLSDAIIEVITKTSQFKSSLTELQQTVTRIKPIINQIEELNVKLNRPIHETEMFIAQLKDAEDLVRECLHIKWRFFKKYPHSLKLENLNKSLMRFCQVEVQLLITRCILDLSLMTRGSSGWSCGVPLLNGDVIGFEDRVRDLKAMVLKDSEVDDCSVVVVSAAGGCGKTTLVTSLCHDPDIKGKFGRNIYFVTISETPNIKVIVKNLLQKNQGGQQLDFASDEDATRQWGSFLGENKSQLLLVLDDVWDASIVTKFKFKSPTYKILVTSRCIFNQFKTYELQLLNDQDATKLFRHSAFSADGSERNNISDALVDELVKHCKNHPLALSVIGGLLKGTDVASWDGMLKKLSEGMQSVLDLDESILVCLERSLDVLQKEPVIKQCFLDLGLFPEDHKIAATMLMDMWVHLYKHDEDGLNTINKLTELSSKNLATRLQIRKHLPVVANYYCAEESVVQHDMLRRLAIKLSSQEPIEERMRLIIKANEPDGQVLPLLQHPLDARILSISTDERFSMTWNDYQVSNVEVLVLNFMSKIYDLPPFMQNMQRLKVLIITNYGYYFSELHNFPPQALQCLTSIRLEHVSISSIATSITELVNLKKLSLIMCEMGNSFNECTPNKLPNLLEIEMESCGDLVTFPALFCNLPRLKKLSITNCLELISLSEGLGNLRNLEVLRLASCSNLRDLPESMRNFHKLHTIDLNYCLHVSALPAQIGELGRLKTIHMIGCTGVEELPSSVKDLRSLKVVCDEEIHKKLWNHLMEDKVQVVEEDRLSTLLKIIS